MTQTPATRYRSLETRLIEGRQAGTLAQHEDDLISEDMAELWYQLSDQERQDARVRIAPYVKSLEEP